jgi:hypothetical protein
MGFFFDSLFERQRFWSGRIQTLTEHNNNLSEMKYIKDIDQGLLAFNWKTSHFEDVISN